MARLGARWKEAESTSAVFGRMPDTNDVCSYEMHIYVTRGLFENNADKRAQGERPAEMLHSMVWYQVDFLVCLATLAILS